MVEESEGEASRRIAARGNRMDTSAKKANRIPIEKKVGQGKASSGSDCEGHSNEQDTRCG
jgi:hypothetical protein